MGTSFESESKLDHIFGLLVEVESVMADMGVPASFIEICFDHLEESNIPVIS